MSECGELTAHTLASAHPGVEKFDDETTCMIMRGIERERREREAASRI